MNRFFVDEKIDNSFFITDKEQINHVKKVMRLTVGELVEIVYSEKEYICKIIDIDERVEVEIVEEVDILRESPLTITLFQGLPKADKMELIIQKTTELGIDRIVPINSSRAIMKVKKDSKIDRWEKIAFAASKQSKRNRIPVIEKPIDIEKLLEQHIDKLDVLLVPYENNDEKGLMTILDELKEKKNIGIFIGPEGGIDDSDLKCLESDKTKIISLGNRILRTETAAIMSVGSIQFYLGDLGD